MSEHVTIKATGERVEVVERATDTVKVRTDDDRELTLAVDEVDGAATTVYGGLGT